MKVRAVTLALLCALVATARADKLVVDRVEQKPSRLVGMNRVRALISATVTGGKVVDNVIDEKTRAPLLKLKVGGAPIPFLHGAFEHADVELSLVLLVPTSYRFGSDFEAMRTSIDAQLLEPLVKLGPRVRVQVVGYGSSYTGTKDFVRIPDAKKALAQLEPDSATDEMPLSDILERAYKSAGAQLKKPKQKDKEVLTRAAVLVISSGIVLPPGEDADAIKRAITKIGDDAAGKQVRIHSIAYSPLVGEDEHRAVRPLLALGEVSLRSHGTFRWVKTDGGWDPAFAEVAKEIRRQQVVTFFAPPEELEGKKLTATMPVGTAQLAAEPVPVGRPKCGQIECELNAYCVNQICYERRVAAGGGMVVKVLIFGGIGIGTMIALLGTIAFLRRRRTAGQPPLAPAYAVNAGQVGLAPAPGVPYHAPAAAAPAPAAAPGGPVFIVLTGPNAGQRIALRHGFSVGKAHGSDLDLSHDSFASGSHAQVVFDGSGWVVTDLGSTNGTFSNGVRITQTRLDPGMTVRFGSTEVRFWVG